MLNSLRKKEFWEAYEVGWDFVIAPEQQQWQPHQNHAASHTGEGPSFILFLTISQNLQESEQFGELLQG